MNNFDLVYVQKSTNKVFYVKRLLLGEYKIREGIDAGTERKISRHELKRDFTFQERVSMESVREKTKPILMTRTA
jgi:hypothetical protein